jgi:glutathione-independent formaldehyde dehydrogenase
VMPFNISCGVCYNCLRGFTNACLQMNPTQAGAAYGYPSMGPYQGAQAEYVLVPNADWAALKLPGEPGDAFEDDFVLLADIFPTGYHATELAGVQSGGVVVIFGAGPVGLLSAMSAGLKGAAMVYVVDRSPSRLQMAAHIGAIPIDYSQGDPVEQIQQHISENRTLMASWRGGEDKLIGADSAIDAVGYEAFSTSSDGSQRNDETQVLRDCVRILNATGKLGVIGVYMPQDPGAPSDQEKHGMLTLPFGELWSKGISVGTGQAPAKTYQIQLRNLIIAGKAKPSMIITDRVPIAQAPDIYAAFQKRDEVIKPVLKAA